MIVALHGVEFFAYHGFYPEEQKLGSHFIVDIEVAFTPTGDINEDNLDNTVNYEQLYEIACDEMKRTKKLIETVAQDIMDNIINQYNFVDTVKLTIYKLNPLVGAKTGSSSVTLNYSK
ncbi:dihydroneopterin aldolase [Mucilaginibacter sp. dw_454]|uniref:dihydroneopterin aldolase n=1 Tax=Mucilaginibacter sp. dw_454 TaxID=2720079 RepID=UPI001BD6C195|nr:dihydroneopterin aldolase [Mucilaginibacter sp. dw_454]